MYGFKECSSCGALYNREHCCSNVSSVDNFVRDPNPISYDETPDSSQQPPRNCSKCGGSFGGLYCRQCTCERCRRNYTNEVCALCCYEVEKSFVNDSNPNAFIDDLSNSFDHPPQPQTRSFESNGDPPQVSFVYNQDPCYNQNQAANIIHQPPQEMSIQNMEDLKQQYLDEMKNIGKSGHSSVFIAKKNIRYNSYPFIMVLKSIEVFVSGSIHKEEEVLDNNYGFPNESKWVNRVKKKDVRHYGKVNLLCCPLETVINGVKE
ncbi:hypothetical protein Tco_1008091 [Tanacetum coccineum]